MSNDTPLEVKLIRQSLHDQIMWLPCIPSKDTNLNQAIGYMDGHRDARHAAAELAAAHEAEQAAPVAVPDVVREAIEIAIDCLDKHGDGFVGLGAHTVLSGWLSSAPTPPAQQPVAWMHEDGSSAWTDAKKRLAIEHAGTPGALVAQKYNLPLYAAPPAQQSQWVPSSLLTSEDMRRLRRFQEICEDPDADGHDVPKEAMKRLERIGVVRSCGFGRHETTEFGDAVLSTPGDTAAPE